MKGRAPEQKLPITPVIFQMFHRYLDVRNAYDVTFFAACVVAFLTVFRKSTLLSKSVKDHDPGKNICRRDVEFTEQGFLISIKHNRQSSAMNVRWKSHWCAQDVHFVQWMPCVHYGSVFLTYRHTRRRFLTLGMGVWNVLLTRTLCRKYSPWYFGVGWNLTTIRLEGGGCTWAWKNNMPTEYIMLQGDWRSTSWLSYLEIPLVTRWKMAKLLAESVHL